MCSGLEHLSNCHGELTCGIMLFSSLALWLRHQRFKIKMWFANRKVEAAKRRK